MRTHISYCLRTSKNSLFIKRFAPEFNNYSNKLLLTFPPSQVFTKNRTLKSLAAVKTTQDFPSILPAGCQHCSSHFLQWKYLCGGFWNRNEYKMKKVAEEVCSFVIIVSNILTENSLYLCSPVKRNPPPPPFNNYTNTDGHNKLLHYWRHVTLYCLLRTDKLRYTGWR
jgi:hypothetical protein